MSFSRIYENIAVRIGCINARGSGLLFKIPSQDYAYVFTAKHCLEGTPQNLQSFSIEDIKVDRLKNEDWNELEVIDFKLHHQADLALIVVKAPEDIEGIVLAEKNYRDSVTVYGFPDYIKDSSNPAESFDAVLLRDQNNIIELQTNYDLSTFEQGALTYLPGFSGSGVFIETQDRKIALVGIFTEIKERQFGNRKLNAESVEQFHEILSTTSYEMLPPLKPEHILKKVFYHAKTLNEWRQDKKLDSTEWIELERNKLLIKDIQEHFFNEDSTNVLHLVGRSGIGKTRTTLQACIDNQILSNVLYFDSYDLFSRSVNNYKFDREKKYYFIIDDITMGEWEELNRYYSLQNVRIITLGVSPEHKLRALEGLRIIESPSNEEIITLITNINPAIDSLSREKISRLCDKDLRLLILLLRTYQREQSLVGIATQVSDKLFSLENILDRILNQFSSEIGDVIEFKKYYSKLCLFIDIGIKGDFKEEISYLAEYFGLNKRSMYSYIEKANVCWLGLMKNEFFETLPRALSRYIFENESWHFVKHDLSAFINGMPTHQMKKRFINRIEECHESFRQEVSEELSEWFLETFYEHKIDLLNNVENAKVFKVYTEFSPEIGLRWLKRTLNNASKEELLDFKGGNGFFGSNKERRYIVWLCEHLACFKEYFWMCEEILFILAQNETELHISNNSKGVWMGLFTPILSNTEVPFEPRYDLLLRRLEKSSIFNMDLIFEALGTVFKGVGSRIVPPKVVGGRIVPKEWRPASEKELSELLVKSMGKLINTLSNIQDNRTEKIKKIIIDEFSIFIDFGRLKDVKALFEKYIVQEETKIKLKSTLEKISYNYDKYDHYIENIEGLRGWLKDLENLTFDSIIKEFILGDYWDKYHMKGEEIIEREVENLAKELLNDKKTIEKYLGLIEKNENNVSTQLLMRKIGFLDVDRKFEKYITLSIIENKSVQITISYLQGLMSKEHLLPRTYTDILNSYEEQFPDNIFLITIRCDISESGYERLLRILSREIDLNVNSIESLLQIQYSKWNDVLKSSQMLKLCSFIQKFSTNTFSRYIILKLCHGYYHYNKIQNMNLKMSEFIIEVMLECINDDKYKLDDWDWQEVFKLIADELVEKKIILLINVLNSKKTGHSQLEIFALKYIKELAGNGYSEHVMSHLGKAILNDTNYVFYLHVYKGLFESIELKYVKKWIEENGIEAARIVARHIESPVVRNNNDLYIPPLTEWILEKFDWDDRLFREFLAGRHSFEVVNISSVVSNHEKFENEMRPHVNHKLSRIGQWVEYEIQHSESFKKHEEIRRTREEREF